MEKHIRVARFFPGSDDLSNEQALDNMVKVLFDWVKEFNVPKFGYYGVTKEDIDRIVKGSGQKE